jgi:hypothetical protein
MKLKDVWLKSLQDKEFAKLEKIKKLDLLKKPVENLDVDNTQFTTMLSKLPTTPMKVEWMEDALAATFQEKLVEHKKALEETLVYAPGATWTAADPKAWWISTNDSSKWGKQYDSPHYHVPALSVSATSSHNYTQIFASPNMIDAIKSYKPKMTRELAIAMNNGEVY